MKWLFGFLNACFTFLLALPGFGQGLKGLVQRDTAYISMLTPAFESWELFAARWNLSSEPLMRANPGISPGNFSGTREVLVPLAGILKSANCQDCQPVYHTVRQSEGLFRIGQWYEKTNIATLRQLNGLRSDALKPGQKLVVGYVDIKPTEGFAKNTSKEPLEPPGELNNTEAESFPIQSNQEIKEKEPLPELSYTGLGVFETEWSPIENSISKKSGKAASFKSESGWADGRFYLLHTQLKQGLIVKLTNPKTGGSLFAKVVGPLPKIKQNDGLHLRISNAAAAMLGVWDENQVFELSIEF